MSVSLYRKYRPVRFEDIIGQDHVARTLVNAINQDRVSHAYLFTGPRGTGKTSTAKILAMALNCDAGGGKATATPDGTCPHCEAIRRGSAMDVVEMDAASNRGIDDIRDLRDKVHFSPVEGRMKVYIVDEVHMLTQEAFNALLKTLEEPPAHAVFVLATTEPHRVPPTILSRCQRFDFRRPSITEVVRVLTSIAAQEGIEVSETALTVMARSAGGSFRDAIGTLDQLSTYSDGVVSLQATLDILGVVRHDLLFELVDLVHEGDAQQALLFVERLSQSGSDYVQFMKDLLGHLRDLYVTMHTAEIPASVALPEEQLERLRSQARRVQASQAVLFVDLLGEALRAVRQGSDPRLELELVLLKMTALNPTGAIRGDVPGGDVDREARDRATAESAARHATATTGASSSGPSSGETTPAVGAMPSAARGTPPAGGEAPSTAGATDDEPVRSTRAQEKGTGPAGATESVQRARPTVSSEPRTAPEALTGSKPATDLDASTQLDAVTKLETPRGPEDVAQPEGDTQAEGAKHVDGAMGQEEIAQPEAAMQSDGKQHIAQGAPPPHDAVEPIIAERGPAPGESGSVKADVDHLRRAWPLVVEAVKKRQAGLSAVLAEGRPESLENDELVIRFPTGYTFQADQVTRGDNPRILAEVLREITGMDFRVVTRLATDPAAPAAEKEENARILSKDELIRVLQQEFDAREID